MENKNQRPIFSQDTAPIILAILEKYNLNESTEQALEKTIAGKLLNAGIILNTTEEAHSDIDVKNRLANILEKELVTSPEIAKDIAKDIENQLIPLINSPETKISEKPSSPVNATVKNAPNIPKKFNTNRLKKIDKNNQQEQNNSQPKQQINTSSTEQTLRQNDSYREPLV